MLPSSTVSWSLLKFTPIKSVMLLIISSALSPHSPFAFYLSQHQESFLTSHLFASGGQSIGASASASVLPMNIQDWFPLGLTGLISLPSKGLSRVFSSTTIQKNQFFDPQPSLQANFPICTWLLEKPHFDYRDHCWQNNVSALLIHNLLLSQLSFQGANDF